ncbi:SDR family NAD(P)-dependent oxidoreductase [Rhizobium leguminosarum]|uniref:oxidoreductase n=1 Tax=Rhizobium TaxID=379 RepID=UPI00103083E7|nr:oxidoreductase [Rhizobium leguminosarum]TBF87434.1 SDR family NAD(P)-dependent oxidoreductase [Rhizobium leguminosarum]TBG07049.1 SDR family NAD(P)-dependent oxidoreductase [Rhizobium leguminosarum]TBG07801.1 SDR family NAD(P)-dependent oxidoreductase [Rhizobium leguminosarum]TBG30740.1 SDR family NAD(P)-dependent oxidoreductase [Rhizobium leguminosarum]TBG50100.1 SDR family NAD(P)-dependent oxidoreductase [Rhizobium leguminosarum]
MTKTWFITGCSTGFGRALTQHLLSLGEQVVVTARDPRQLTDLVAGHEAKALALKLDVTKQEHIASSIKAAEDRFGAIDVLVNNAGHGYFGAFEETDIPRAKRMFDVNLWGVVEVTRAALPAMRRRRAGTIVNFSSVGGLTAFPSLSFYAATKFAVEALSEGLSRETAELGIKVLIVEPSAFRTDWGGRSADRATGLIADYASTAHATMDMVRGWSGQQSGDPQRAAEAIVAAVNAQQPPLRLLLGKAALSGARAKISEMQRDFDAWADVTIGADFPGSPET